MPMRWPRASASGSTLAVLLAMAVLLGGFMALPGRDLVAQPEEELEILLPEPLPLEDFLKVVGRRTDFPLYWDPDSRAIKGKTIMGAQNLRAPRDKLFELVRALLTFYELVIIPVGPPGYQVYLVMDARATGAILRLKPKYVELTEDNMDLYESQDGLFITTTIQVENMRDLRDARNALSRIVTQQNIGNVQEVPAARAFVITDFAPNVVAVARLLQQMDIRPAGKQITSAYVELQHATADEIEPILSELFTGRERVTALPQAPGGQASTAVEEDPEPRIISDFRTNQLIIYGTQDDIDEIREVIAHLDKPVYLPNTWVHVLKLKNLDAEETATVLQTLIEQSTFFGLGTGGTGRAPGGAPTRPGQRPTRPGTEGGVGSPEEEKPAVVADVASNSLLISASPRQFEELKRIIQEIDVKKPQVLIEAALLELTLDDSDRLAFELGLADDGGLLDTDSVSGFGFTSFGLNTFADKDLDTYFTDRIPSFVDTGQGTPTGLVGGIFALGQVPLIFNILNTVSQSRLLQLPSIVTADNEEAVIRVLDKQATTQSTTTSGGNVTGGFGSFEEAGVTLQISPHIADNFYLLLNIRLVVSAFVGEPRVLGDILLPADQVEREIITAVTCPDRHTVVLGGLLGESQRGTVDRTPLLSEIPLLGELFKSTTVRDRDTSLFLFVTPTIMSEPGGFDVLDQASYERKMKADELIGATEIFNAYFPAADLQDPATGMIRGSGSASDRLDELGVLESTRFFGVDPQRLQAERAARRRALRDSTEGGR